MGDLMTNTIEDFERGDRVQLHPATDLWMRGARFGTVSMVGRVFVTVRTDRGPVARLRPADLEVIDDSGLPPTVWEERRSDREGI
jgi:hypothetical protein